MTIELLIAVFFAATGIYALRVARAEWGAGDGADPFQAPEWWPFDLTLWRALLRAGPVGAVEAVFFAGRYVASLPDDSAVADAIATGFGVLIAVTVALIVAVGLYNRPAWAVAPRFRRFPGAIDEWQGRQPTPEVRNPGSRL